MLDLSTIVSRPMCAMILGDHGADVVKVESPAGDTARWLGGAGPPSYSLTPSNVRRTPPTLGQHTGEVLREVGLSDDEISRLGDRGP